MINKKIDFVALISVKNANPNGDPLNGNRPREDMRGYGEISDVALKRKIRNAWLDMGEPVFVQSDEKRVDEFTSLSERAADKLKQIKDKDEYAKAACKEWLDVRGFGQLFAFKNGGKKQEISIGVRGPISIHPAFSIEPVFIEDIQITKSVNGEPGEKKGPDTMGMKYRVSYGLYKTQGSINCQLAEKTGFTDEDAEKLHQAIIHMFDNDASSARPEGSMVVEKLYWFEHDSKNGDYPAFKVHDSIKVAKKEGVADPESIDDFDITVEKLEGLEPEIYSAR